MAGEKLFNRDIEADKDYCNYYYRVAILRQVKNLKSILMMLIVNQFDFYENSLYISNLTNYLSIAISFSFSPFLPKKCCLIRFHLT